MVGWLPASHLSLPGSSIPPCHSPTGICRASWKRPPSRPSAIEAVPYNTIHDIFVQAADGGGGGWKPDQSLNQAKQAMDFFAMFCPQTEICFFLFLRFFWCVEFLIARVFCQSFTLARCTLVVIACVKHLVTPKRSFVSPQALAIQCPAGHSKRARFAPSWQQRCRCATWLHNSRPGRPTFPSRLKWGSSTHLAHANRWKIWSC